MFLFCAHFMQKLDKARFGKKYLVFFSLNDSYQMKIMKIYDLCNR